MNVIKYFDIKKLLFASIFSLYFLNIAFHPDDWHFIDNVNIIFHEAGHTIFIFFGEFMYVLGGTFLQLFIPAFLVFYFYKRQEFFSSSLILFWFGQSLLNVFVYAKDAIVQQLPLLGGDGVGHDWNYILNSINMLEYTDIISNLIFFAGFVTILIACYFSFLYSRKIS